MSVDRLDRLKDPRYTGRSRCSVCTAVNGAIAVVASLAVGTRWPVVGVGVLAVSVALIYLRGYLIPGTPTLTERYVPPRLLAAVHSDGRHPDADLAVDLDDSDGPYAFLDAIGAVTPCTEGDGICLAGAFRERREERMERPRQPGDGSVVDLPDGDPEVDDLSVEVEGTTASMWSADRKVGYWNSWALMRTDLASWETLAGFPGWESLPRATKRDAVGALRVFVDRCPLCAVPITAVKESGRGCCSGHANTRVTGRCPECETAFYRELATPVAPYDRERTHAGSTATTVPPGQ